MALRQRKTDKAPDFSMKFLLDGIYPPLGSPELFEAWQLRFNRNGCARDLWNRIRSQALPAFIRKNPGRRPWAWWKFDSPEPRRAIGADGQPIRIEWQRGSIYFFGMHRSSRYSQFESEATYLKRHGLLSEAEEKRLKPADFKPVQISPDGITMRRLAKLQMQRKPQMKAKL